MGISIERDTIVMLAFIAVAGTIAMVVCLAVFNNPVIDYRNNVDESGGLPSWQKNQAISVALSNASVQHDILRPMGRIVIGDVSSATGPNLQAVYALVPIGNGGRPDKHHYTVLVDLSSQKVVSWELLI